MASQSPTELVDTTDAPGVAEVAPGPVPIRTVGRRLGLSERRLPSPRPPLHQFLLADVSGLAVAAAVSLGHPTFALLAPLVMVVGLRLGDLYKPSTNPSALDQLSAVARGVALASLVLGAATGVSTGFAAAYAATATAAVVAARSVLFAINRRASIRRPRRTLVVGAGAAGQELAGRLLDHPEYGLVPVGFVANDPEPIDPTLPVGVAGEISDLLHVVDALGVERLVVDSGAVGEADLLEVLDRAARRGVEVTVLPVLARHLSTAITVESLAGTTLLTYRPSRHRGVTWSFKRTIDLTGAALLLMLTAPVWAVVAMLIKLTSHGPVLFAQERVGRGGRPFRMYKFRSMVRDAEDLVIDLRDHNEADGPYFKVAGDPRVTPIGRWLRRYSIDELPQLINVVRGEMSLVGPRPALPLEVAEYPDWFRRRLAVPPGMTGLWQVSGRFLLPFVEATRLDVYYVDHWSLGLDLKILTRTLPVVLSGRGAR